MSKNSKNKDMGRFNIVPNAGGIEHQTITPPMNTTPFVPGVQAFSGKDIGDNIMGYISHLELDKLEDAPTELNFYEKISDSKMSELIDSILNVGLQNPIIVWDQDNGKYMILSGHNRVQAFKMILSTLPSNEELKKETDLTKKRQDEQLRKEFSKIKVKVYRKDELTLAQAKAIIVDTNWVVRDMTTIQKAKSIYVKYVELKEEASKLKQRRNINKEVQSLYNLEERQVINYKKLILLIPELQNMINDGNLSIENGAALSKLTNDVQLYLYENYSNKEISSIAKKVKATYDKKDIENLLAKKVELSTIKISLPKELESAFEEELEALKEKYNLKFNRCFK